MTKLVPSLLMRFDIALANPNEEPEQHCWYACVHSSLDFGMLTDSQ